MKDAYYFTHDSNARNDPKILAMRSVYGAEGYGWFWMIVEILREQNGYALEANDYFTASLALELHEDEAKIKAFISDCTSKFHLFFIEKNKFTSVSLLRRMAYLDQKREQARSAALSRWSGSNADALRLQSGSNASKVNKSKVNKSKVNKIYGEFQNIFLSEDEHRKLEERLNSQLPVLIESMSAWLKQNGKTYKDYYAALLNWSRRPINGATTNGLQQGVAGSAGISYKDDPKLGPGWSGAVIHRPS